MLHRLLGFCHLFLLALLLSSASAQGAGWQGGGGLNGDTIQAVENSALVRPPLNSNAKTKKRGSWLSRLFRTRGDSPSAHTTPKGEVPKADGPFDTQKEIDIEQEVHYIPAVCQGSTERFWVRGENGSSYFTWTLTTPSGEKRVITAVPSGAKSKVSSGKHAGDYTRDTVEILFDKPGIYSIEVVETHASGCEGEPYIVGNVLVSSPEMPVALADEFEKFGACSGEYPDLDLTHFANENLVDTIYLFSATDNLIEQKATNKEMYVTALDGSGTYKLQFYSRKLGCKYDVDVKEYPSPIVRFEPDNQRLVYPGPPVKIEPTVYLQEKGKPERKATRADLGTAPYVWETDKVAPYPAWAGYMLNQPTDRGYIEVTSLDGDQHDWVTVTTVHGCKATADVYIKVADIDNIRIPAAFTPNGDGINDYWYLPAPLDGMVMLDKVKVRDVHVYDRWGRLVYKQDEVYDNNNPWDGRDMNGRDLPMDSYHYELSIDGNGEARVVRGTITIVR